MKVFLNTCVECKSVTNKGVWRVDIKKGPISTSEFYEVGAEQGPNPEHFDLDIIDVKDLANRYKISIEDAEEMIMNGVVLCPFCKSENFFEYSEEMDSQFKIKLL